MTDVKETKTSLNTHDYDGKLKGLSFYNFKTVFSKQEKEAMFDKLIAKLVSINCPIGIPGLNAIKSSIQTPANFDASNGWYADDILADLCVMVDKQFEPDQIKTYLTNISEQMFEMMISGPCPQGRCARLLLIYLFARDHMLTCQWRVQFDWVDNMIQVSIVLNWNINDVPSLALTN